MYNKRIFKLFIAVISAFYCILVDTALSDTNWNVESGNWSVDANWSTGTKPDDTQNVNLRYSAVSICTLNTNEGLFAVRLFMSNGQTLNIEDGGSIGFAWTRIGYGGPAAVNMSGDGTYVLNNDDLYIGEYNGSCVWTMSDSSSIVLADASQTDDNLYIGKDGDGILRLIGSNVTVTPSRIDFGWVRTAGCTPAATIEYVMDAGGAGTVVVQKINRLGDAGSTAHLVLSATADLPQEDIILIEATDADGIGGNGVFNTMNGGSAAEGTFIVLGGNLYSLTYAYDAAGDSNNNDIALVYESDSTAAYKAHSPVPGDGGYVIDSPALLSWTNPLPADGISSIICTVYFGTSSNRLNMDSVTLAPNANSVEINAANFPAYGAQPLTDGIDYYWIVDCADVSPGIDPAAGVGYPWTFHTYLSLPEYDGFGGQATGGQGGSEVIVDNASDLKYWAYTSTVPCIITIAESFTMSGGNGVSGGACPVGSNKTIQGANPGIVFTGNLEMKSTTSNVIIRNLTITNPDDRENPDGASIGGSDCITIYGAHNVHITHCTIVDAADGLLDIRDAADNITISWCKFYYTFNNGHNLASLGAGAGDEDSGPYHITWHHNWWADKVNSRMPMIRFGSAHMYNNYFHAPGNYYCTSSRVNAEILSQYNYYQDVINPIYIEPGSAGKVRVEDNIYENCSSPYFPLAPGTDTVFMPPYDYALDPVEEVPAVITACAGNRLYGDFDGDGTVDTEDLAVFSELWLNDSSRVAFYQDLDGNGLVGLYEFASFAANWLIIY